MRLKEQVVRDPLVNFPLHIDMQCVHIQVLSRLVLEGTRGVDVTQISRR